MQLKFRAFFIFFLSLLMMGLWGGIWSVSAAVRLTYFRATPGDKRIDLEWETASEIGSSGFYVLRSPQSTSVYERISDFIWVTGEGSTGSVYTFSDTGLTNGTTYYYKLEAINNDQSSEFHDPISATAGVSSTATATSTSTSTATPTRTHTITAVMSPTTTITATPTHTLTPSPTLTHLPGTAIPTSTRPPGTATPTITRTATYSSFATVARTSTPSPGASPSATRPTITTTYTLTATVSATVAAMTSPATAIATVTAMPSPTSTASAIPVAAPETQPEEPPSITLILGGIAAIFVLGLGGWAVFGSMRGGRVK